MKYRSMNGAAALLAISTFVPTAFGQVCTQSTDNVNVIAGNSVACATPAPQLTVENQYFRRYSPATDCASPGGFTIGSVSFGIENALAGAALGFVQPANIKIYTIATGDPILFANMTQVNDTPILIADAALVVVTENLSSAVNIPAGFDAVVELFLPDGVPDGNVFFAGSNNFGTSGRTYLAAVTCGITEPTDVVGIGFPDMQIILDIAPPVSTTIGTNYCVAANNATGTPGVMGAMGSAIAADNNVTLEASNLPVNQFGIFVCSLTQGFNPGAGGTSNGNLCVGGAIGRFSDILSSGGAGSFSRQFSLNSYPQGMGTVAVMSGDTWNYQAWHRELGGLGSNFTDGLSITFQ